MKPSSYSQTVNIPPGIQPPYQGAPPLPHGWKVNPQAWQAGFWSFNPAYNPQAGPTTSQQQQWVAGQAWRPQQQQQQPGASYNPYKRVPKPPSAEYLATKLSDNPLGLTNMVPREEVYGKESQNDGNPAHTPWIWNPRDLDDDDSNEAIITAEFRDPAGRRTEYRGPAPRRRSSATSPEPSPTKDHTAQLNRGFSSASSTPSQSIYPAPKRHSSEPPPDRSQPASQVFSSASRAAQQHAKARPQRPPSFQYGPPTETSNDQDSFAESPQRSFSSPQPLRTTFSTSIVRTPDHYGPTRRGSTDLPQDVHSAQPKAGTMSVDKLTSQLARMSSASAAAYSLAHSATTTPTKAAPLSRHQSLPEGTITSSNTGFTSGTLVDEPSSLLSPLVFSDVLDAQNGPSRPITRGHSHPTLGSIPEGGYPTEASRASKSHPPNYSHALVAQRERTATKQEPYSRSSVPPVGTSVFAAGEGPSPGSSLVANGASNMPHHSSPTRNHASAMQQPLASPSGPLASSPAAARISSQRSSPSGTSPSPNLSQNSTPTRSYHLDRTPPSASQTQNQNPLPPPPMESRYVASLGLDAQSRHHTPRRTRVGYWNRRGDHLTKAGRIVYAPPDQAYPAELSQYPEESAGYQNDKGNFIPYDPSRPELDESLPRFGRPPTQPYASFIAYIS